MGFGTGSLLVCIIGAATLTAITSFSMGLPSLSCLTLDALNARPSPWLQDVHLRQLVAKQGHLAKERATLFTKELSLNLQGVCAPSPQLVLMLIQLALKLKTLEVD